MGAARVLGVCVKGHQAEARRRVTQLGLRERMGHRKSQGPLRTRVSWGLFKAP